MFLKNNDLGVFESALIPHLFPHFFVVFARHLTGFFRGSAYGFFVRLNPNSDIQPAGPSVVAVPGKSTLKVLRGLLIGTV